MLPKVAAIKIHLDDPETSCHWKKLCTKLHCDRVEPSIIDVWTWGTCGTSTSVEKRAMTKSSSCTWVHTDNRGLAGGGVLFSMSDQCHREILEHMYTLSNKQHYNIQYKQQNRPVSLAGWRCGGAYTNVNLKLQLGAATLGRHHCLATRAVLTRCN